MSVFVNQGLWPGSKGSAQPQPAQHKAPAHRGQQGPQPA